ncbi:MAG: polysaccharide biosynthesis protein [Clostridia bacterium]|nr:polysaccharide biosynthesis protein [Clostridia bacterium]
MKKVLVLSCSTGQGHDSCAKAVKEYFDEQNVCCEVRDALEFDSKRLAWFMSWGHSFMYRHMPWLFKKGYSYSENHPSVFKESSLVFRILTSGTDKIYDYIAEGGFDTIICTHVFSAMILTYMQKQHPMDVKTSFVATDYTCSPSMEKSDLQYYFIPHESLTEEFMRCGIPKERIIPVGIPVRTDFVRRTDRREAKQLLEINPDSKHMLIMCGSMGCGPIAKTVVKLSKIIPDDVEVTVVCGTNKSLFKKLLKKYRHDERIHIVGYTDKISLYMDATDLYLTKPGGISSTEAAMKCVPMLLADVVAGCELHNMKFFGDMGAAVIEKSLSNLAEKSIELIRDTKKLKEMEKALENYNQSVGTRGIFDNLKD